MGEGERRREQEIRGAIPREVLLAHDLKNVAHRLGLLLESLAAEDEAGANGSGAVEALRDAVERLRSIAGELVAGATRVDEVAGAGRLLGEAQRSCGAALRGNVIVEERYDGTAAIRGDATLLRGAFARAIENAFQAMNGEGRLLLRARVVRGRAVVVEIVDSGPGMREGFVRDELFRPRATGRPDGSGLGAWTYRRVAELHGGSVSVRSAPGRGTRVRFRFPPRRPAQGQDASAASISASRSPTWPAPNES